MIIADHIAIFPPEDAAYQSSANDTDEQLFRNEAAVFNCVVHDIRNPNSFNMGEYEVSFAGEDETKLRELLDICGYGHQFARWTRNGDRLTCELL